MTPVNAAARLTLELYKQQPMPAAPQKDEPLRQPNLAAIANGLPDTTPTQDGKPAKQAQAQIAEALFDKSRPNVTELKFRLFDAVGKAFGLKKEDFATYGAMGQAIYKIFLEYQNDPGFQAWVWKTEKELGLHALGLSLRTVIKAMIDPGGAEDDDVEAAIQDDLDKKESQKEEQLLLLQTDELGLYAVKTS